MSKLERINKNTTEMRVAVATLEIEAKAAKAALAVSSEALDQLKEKIEQTESLIKGLQNEIASEKEKLQTAKEERDKLKSRT